MILLSDSECPDQSAQKRRLIEGLHCPHMPEDSFSHGASHISPGNLFSSQFVSSGSTLFAQACLSECTRSIRYVLVTH